MVSTAALRRIAYVLALGAACCAQVLAQGVTSLATGTYQFTFNNAQPGAPLPSGRSLNMVLAPGGAVCVASYLFLNPVVNGAGTQAVWEGPSIGMKLSLPSISAGFNNIALQTTAGAPLGTFSGTRTSGATTGCSAGSLDFATVNSLFTKAEAQYPALFPVDFVNDVLRIVEGTISRIYNDSGITLRVANGRVLISGGSYGVTPRDVGDVNTIISTLLNGPLKPRAFPDQQVSWTIAGGLAPVLVARPSSAQSRADDLAGVNRSATANWKEYVSGRARATVIVALKPKLKSIIEDLWSNNGGILFPESFGIIDSISKIIDGMKGLQYENVPNKLKPSDISNLSYEYMTLKRLLATSEASSLFTPLPLAAVELAVPAGGFADASMKPLGAEIKKFVAEWLVTNAASGSGGSTGGGGTTSSGTAAIIDQIFTIMMLDMSVAANGFAGTSVAATQAEIAKVDTLLGRMPSGYDNLRAKTIAFYNGQLVIARCQDRAVNFCIDESAALLPLLEAFGTAAAPATTQANTGSGGSGGGAATAETGAQFYNRFLTDLATAINGFYENQFDAFFKNGDARSYTPVVIQALLYDTTRIADPLRPGPDNCCGFRDNEQSYYDQQRSGVLYRARGEDVKFGSSDSERFTLVAPLTLERLPLTASSLNSRRGEALTLPKQVVLANGSTPLVYVAACVAADQACMQRLAITNGSSAVDTYNGSSASWSSYFGLLSTGFNAAGGLPLYGPVWYSLSTTVDMR